MAIRVIDAWMQHPTKPELVDYLKGRGRRKVLFGSNHPAWPALMCLEGFDELGLDDETRELFLHGNAERVFGLVS